MTRRLRPNFWDNVLVRDKDKCWPWLRGRVNDGYGIAPWKGKQTRAHRVAWMLTHGEIPIGYELDHMCHTRECTAGANCPHRRCCNPHHLKLATRAENAASDRQHRPGNPGLRVTHCPRGHEYTPENTRVASHGGRNCRECEHARRR